jgi:hypothetical protein
MGKKQKESTFEQIMKASAVVNARYSSYEKANDRYSALVDNFPECETKLFTFDGKTYVVTSQRWPSVFSVTEVNT